MADNLGEKLRQFLFPRTPDEEYNRYVALGGEVLDVGGDGGPLIEGYPKLSEKDQKQLPLLAEAARDSRMRWDKEQGRNTEKQTGNTTF